MNRREAALAGFRGDLPALSAGLADPDPAVRAAALGGLERAGLLQAEQLLTAAGDAAPLVRRRAAELAARHRATPMLGLLRDPEPLVAEMAAWTCGEHESVDDDTLDELISMATGHADALVREAAIAALGAIGDQRGRAAVLAGTTDKPAVRRRSVIALVAFDGPDVEAAMQAALGDRDWQVREAAEELLRDQ